MSTRLAPAILGTLLALQNWRNEVEQELRSLLDQQATDWNQGNLEQFLSAYDHAESTTLQAGLLERGWDNISARYRKDYPSPAAMGKLKYTDISIRLLGTSAAIICGKVSMKREAGTANDTKGAFSLVCRRTASGWKIVHDHSPL